MKVIKKQCSLLNYALVKQTKNTPINKKIWTKKQDVQDVWNAPGLMFLNFQENEFLRVFLLFIFDKGKPYFKCIKAEF